MNALYCGDNLDILREHNKGQARLRCSESLQRPPGPVWAKGQGRGSPTDFGQEAT